jgi:RNA polymerase sigma-70 factor (ECF subfamily)
MAWDEIVTLVERARTGDRAAYSDLFERFKAAVFAVAMAKLHNVTEAEELVQEVFIHGMTKLAQLRDPRCFAGWLRQITVRMAINRLTRQNAVQGGAGEALDNAPDAGKTPLEEMVRAEQKAAVWDGLRRLKTLDRDTLVAFYIRGHSLKRMSREFETPVGTIKRRLHVARNRLREVLEHGDKEEVSDVSVSDASWEESELACV